MRGETVVRIRAGASTSTDAHRNPIPGVLERCDIPGCLVDPGASTEPTEVGRVSVRTTPTVYAPPGTDVASTDQLEVRGDVYEVDGRVAAWRTRGGAERGVVIPLKLVEG